MSFDHFLCDDASVSGFGFSLASSMLRRKWDEAIVHQLQPATQQDRPAPPIVVQTDDDADEVVLACADDVERDSPAFVPEALRSFAAGGFKRVPRRTRG